MLFSSNSGKGKHRRPSKTVRYATLAGITGAAVAVPLIGATSASAATTSEWDAVAQCESGGNWSINTGNGYYGGLQFSASTWAAYGGSAFASSADQASKSQQIQIAEKVLAGQGKGAWPSCGVGLSNASNDAGSADPAPQEAAPKEQPAPQKSEPRAEQEQPASRGETRGPVKKGDGEYKVKAGDTLSKIAEAKKVDGGWKKLFKLNKDIIEKADVIFPGQQLHLS
ncbi:transglycosylase family protein [Streptomyces sp. NP-1717]|uniref:transglycosylase family protein n=1 Tax=unclassified Streptomyces TaxID=2593676 RepID=UPI001F5CE18E|nr:transglycosylase family protein [Streptomyces sp. NP-1717]MCI3221511.1 LysM peptidoglycan-binding domain-containing protein [Streptomyces sp. NP-1717]WTA73745.1 transglycosylase family protein [Streptomyces sp. NBC_00838]